MKKLLIQLDTDVHPSVFDVVVGYDGGADQVLSYGGVTVDNVDKLVEGAIFTRPPKEKHNTAIFIGGSDLSAGQDLLSAVTSKFFGEFRVSVMLDSNGSNTTAAAGVARLLSGQENFKGKKAIVLAGTGPVGQRAATMLAQRGAQVALTSRSFARAESACNAMNQRFGVELVPVEVLNSQACAAAVADTNILFATGAPGVSLIDEKDWITADSLELIADANATPPSGIAGIDMKDRGTIRHGKAVWGAIGFGTLKLALHKRCVSRLFESTGYVLDAEQICEIACELV